MFGRKMKPPRSVPLRLPQSHMGMAAVLINLALITGLLITTVVTMPGAHAQDAAAPQNGEIIRVVAFGDSLTAGYGLKPG